MRTRKIILTTIWITAILITATAIAQQTGNPPFPNREKAAVGFSFGHYAYDPGFAIEVTTRPIFHPNLSARLRGGVHWLEAYKATHYHWATYHSLGASLVYYLTAMERTRVYAELGVIGLFPDVRLSDEKYLQGFYEFNGIEITLIEKKNASLCLFLEAGPVFVEAYAEKLESNPRYGNGMTYLCGIRWYR